MVRLTSWMTQSGGALGRRSVISRSKRSLALENPLTGLVLSTGFDIKGTAGDTSWAPTARLLIPNLLGGVLGTQNLTLVYTTTGKPATWNVDDVFVDPFKSR